LPTRGRSGGTNRKALFLIALKARPGGSEEKKGKAKRDRQRVGDYARDPIGCRTSITRGIRIPVGREFISDLGTAAALLRRRRAKAQNGVEAAQKPLDPESEPEEAEDRAGGSREAGGRARTD